jgi:hypothetical protein
MCGTIGDSSSQRLEGQAHHAGLLRVTGFPATSAISEQLHNGADGRIK